MPTKTIEVSHGQDTGSQIAEVYRAFADHLPVGTRVTVEFRAPDLVPGGDSAKLAKRTKASIKKD